MTTIEEDLKSLLNQVEVKERSARQKALLWSILPILVAVIVLAYVGWRINQANQALSAAEAELQVSQEKLNQVSQTVTQEQQKLTEAQTALTRSQKDLEAAKKSQAEIQTQLDVARTDLDRSRRDIQALQKQVEQLQGQIDQKNDELNKTIAKLQEAVNYRRYIYNGDLYLLEKSPWIYQMLPQKNDLLNDMVVHLNEYKWLPGGISPDTGFDSPSFAAWILEKHNLLPGKASELRYKLRDILPGIPQPGIGDVVFYENGYTMFYYKDEEDQPFVFGMTPFGLQALNVNFVPIIGYGAVNPP